MRQLFVTLLLSTASAPAVNVVIDYSYSLGYFQEGTLIRQSLDKAASDLSSVLASGQLAAVPSRTAPAGSASYVSNGSIVTSSAQFHTAYTIKHPAYGDTVRLVDETFAEDEFRIYVGRRDFAGSLIASTTRVESGLGMFGSGYETNWQMAVDQAAANASAFYGRGSGIIAQSITGAIPLGGSPGTYSVTYGPMAASIWFANDERKWQYDHNASVAPDEYDFYTVALNQMLIALGATPPSLDETGIQTGITQAHLSALQSAGWIVVPEPTSVILVMGSSMLTVLRRRRSQSF